MTPSQRLISNSIVLSVAAICQRGVASLFSIVVARLLAVENFGAYSVVLVLVGLAEFLADLNVSQLAIREIARDEKGQAVHLSQLAALRIGLAFVVYAGLLVGLPFLGYDDLIESGVRIAGLGMLFNAWSGSINALFIARERPAIPSAVFLANGILFSAISIICLWAGVGLLSVFWVKVGVDAATAAAFYVIFRLQVGWALIAPTGAALVGLIRKARPFVVIGVLAVIQERADVLILSKLAPGAPSLHVAYYAVGHALLKPFMILSQSIAVAMLPSVSAAMHLGRDLGRIRLRLLKVAAVTFFGLSIPVTIATWMLGEWTITHILGAQFAPAAPSARVLAFAYALHLVNGPFAMVALCSRDFMKYSLGYALIVLATVAAELILVPLYGHVGAAMGNLLAGLTVGSFLFWVVWAETREPAPGLSAPGLPS